MALLYNTTFCRSCFFVLWLLSIILNAYVLEDHPLYVLFILTVIFGGLGYYNQPKNVIAGLGVLVVMSRIILIPDSPMNYFAHFITYTTIMLISVELMKNYRQTKESSIELVLALANSLDSRDSYTGTHSKNVAKYAYMIAKEMSLPQTKCDDIYTGGLLHDIGKIGIPEHLLTKNGKLTAEEYKVIQQHTVIGYDTIKHISSFRDAGILDMVRHHHERFDGKGYPDGLKGRNIPLAARIIALADAFDAMTSRRLYRGRLEWDEILHEIKANKGTQFDPEATVSFMSMLKREGASLIFRQEDVKNEVTVPRRK